MLDYTLLIPTFTPTTITTDFSNMYPLDDLPTAQYYVGAHSNDSYHDDDDDDDDDLSYYESTPAPAFYAVLYYHELKPFAPTSNTLDPFAALLPPQVTLHLPTLVQLYPYPVTADTSTNTTYYNAAAPSALTTYTQIVPIQKTQQRDAGGVKKWLTQKTGRPPDPPKDKGSSA
jgi:hypothetical protein